MTALALPSLEVQRFRGFQDLRIGKLGRVNLIVGKNNIGKTSLLEAIHLYARRAYPGRAGARGIDIVSVGVNGLDKQEIARLWDRITLTDYEQHVLNALRIIAPGIEAINIVSNAQSTCGERTPIVEVQGIPEPLPLHTLGDGIQRTLGIALALVNAQNGILLIDEVENGLHYSVQEDLWKLMFQIARQLNVQIFATTHSWDCIAGFQQAAQVEENEEGVLIRLEYKKDDIIATIFDERKVSIATREHIEVR